MLPLLWQLASMVFRFVLILLALVAPQAVQAQDWLRAEGPTFVVHAKLSEEEIRGVARRLERFDRLLQSQLPYQVRPGRKLQIYLDRETDRMSYAAKMEHFSSTRSLPEIAGSFAQYDPTEDERFRDFPMFAAYTSFYLENSFYRTRPPWLRAGIPTFFATSIATEEGGFVIGIPDVKRPLRGDLSQLRIEAMLAQDVEPQHQRAWRDYLSMSVAFVYPLLTDPQHTGKIETYLSRYNAGKSIAEANSALGDTGELASSIRKFRNGKPIIRQVLLDPTKEETISVSKMSEEQIALVAVRFERLLERNHDATARKLERLTRKYPESAEVWYEYAAAEYARVQDSLGETEKSFNGFGFASGPIVVTAGRLSDALAWDAVKRALDLQPNHPQAIRLRAEIYLARLQLDDTGDTEAEYMALREALEPLAATPGQYPYAATLQFESYLEQGKPVPPKALERLGQAFLANPGVSSFRYVYAAALVRAGEREAAKLLLRSMLNYPRYREAVQRALDQ